MIGRQWVADFPPASIHIGSSVNFFQAEDGIRNHCVTGVQTCALPIYRNREANVMGTKWIVAAAALIITVGRAAAAQPPAAAPSRAPSAPDFVIVNPDGSLRG